MPRRHRTTFAFTFSSQGFLDQTPCRVNASQVWCEAFTTLIRECFQPSNVLLHQGLAVEVRTARHHRPYAFGLRMNCDKVKGCMGRVQFVKPDVAKGLAPISNTQ